MPRVRSSVERPGGALDGLLFISGAAAALEIDGLANRLAHAGEPSANALILGAAGVGALLADATSRLRAAHPLVVLAALQVGAGLAALAASFGSFAPLAALPALFIGCALGRVGIRASFCFGAALAVIAATFGLVPAIGLRLTVVTGVVLHVIGGAVMFVRARGETAPKVAKLPPLDRRLLGTIGVLSLLAFAFGGNGLGLVGRTVGVDFYARSLVWCVVLLGIGVGLRLRLRGKFRRLHALLLLPLLTPYAHAQLAPLLAHTAELTPSFGLWEATVLVAAAALLAPPAVAAGALFGIGARRVHFAPAAVLLGGAVAFAIVEATEPPAPVATIPSRLAVVPHLFGTDVVVTDADTVEAFRRLDARDNVIVARPFSLEQKSPADLARAIATMRASFPNVTLWQAGNDVLLVASRTKLVADAARLKLWTTDSRRRVQLSDAHLAHAFSAFGRFVAANAALDALVADVAPVRAVSTDDNLALALSIAHSAHEDDALGAELAVLRRHTVPDVLPLITGLADDAEQRLFFTYAASERGYRRLAVRLLGPVKDRYRSGGGPNAALAQAIDLTAKQNPAWP